MTFVIGQTRDIGLCRMLRRVVFMEEQGVSEADELDDKDDEAVHLLAWQGDLAVGTARLLFDGEMGKIGRVCVLPQARGLGIGAGLIRASVAQFRQRGDLAKVKLGAQTHALGFYAALGFQPVGDVYDDAGIAHRDMVLRIAAGTED